ncbi:MAG: hypothetical protein RLZZ618_153 [Pseudomonadota bacterium]|jgi:hypothetical protein
MKRLSNPLEGRHALPAHLVARGGNDCTSTTSSSSSCVATVLMSSALSARLALRLGPPSPDPNAKPPALPPDTVPAFSSVSSRHQGTVVLAGLIFLLPPLLALVMPWLWFLVPVLFIGLIVIVSRRVSMTGLFVGRSIVTSWIALFVMIIEMIVWTVLGLHKMF